MPYPWPPRVLLRRSSKGGFGECGNAATRSADWQLWAACVAQIASISTGPSSLKPKGATG